MYAFIVPPAKYESFSHSPAFSGVSILNFNNFNGFKISSGFNLHFLDVKHLFIYIFANLISFFFWSVQVFAHFF